MSEGEPWRPVRFVHYAQTCCMCWHRIPAGSPGSRTGERGTKAWFLPGAVLTDLEGRVRLGPGLWQDLGCHDEQTRAELSEKVK